MRPRSSAPAPLPSAVFVSELGKVRDEKHITQQQLAERLEALGSPIDRSTVGKIEAGRRGIALDDLFAFAAALGVSPLALVVPSIQGPIKVSPAFEADSHDVLFWMRNLYALWPPQLPHDDSDQRFFEDARTDREAKAYKTHSGLLAMEKLLSAMVTLAGSSQPEDADHLSQAASIMVGLANGLVEEVAAQRDVREIERHAGPSVSRSVRRRPRVAEAMDD